MRMEALTAGSGAASVVGSVRTPVRHASTAAIATSI